MCIRDRYYIEELDAMQVPEQLRNYIDDEAYGRDIALEESGQFTLSRPSFVFPINPKNLIYPLGQVAPPNLISKP